MRAEGEVGVRHDTRGHRIASEGGVETGGCQRLTVSRWISGEQWPVACHLSTSPEKNIWFALTSASTRLEQRPAAWSCQRRTLCLNREFGQIERKWLKRAGEMADPCGTVARTCCGGEWSCWWRHEAFLPRRYATQPLQQIVSGPEAVDHLDEEAVRDRIEHLRDVHRYVYCSARGLTLVEASRNGEQGQGCGVPRFEAVLGVVRIPSASTMDGRRSRTNIFTAWQSRVRWGGKNDPGLVTSLPSKSGLWLSSSKFPGCQLWQLRGWRVPSGRPGHAHQNGGGVARWACQAPGRRKSPPS